MTRGGTVNMPAESGNDPPGVLQSPAQPPHYLRCFEVKPVRPHCNLKWRMVGENRNRLGGLRIDQVDQMLDSRGAKVTLVAASTQGIQRNQSYRIVVNRIVDKVVIGRKISARQKSIAQIRPVIPIAGKDVHRRTRRREYSHCLSVFVLPPVMNNIPGVNDYIGGRIERIYVRNRECEIAYSPIGVGCIHGYMGIGDLRDNHCGAPEHADRSPA